VVQSVVGALAQMGASIKGDLPLLADNLSSQDDGLKLATLETLGQLAAHAEPAAAAIQNCLSDRNKTVSEAARATLEKIQRAAQAVAPR
jgi:hypothetical protein